GAGRNCNPQRLVSSRPYRSFPLALPRLCSRSPPRKFASCRQVTSRGYPSARKPARDCKRFPSLLRPWLRSRARLLPVAWPPDQTFPTHGNIARARSSPSDVHSDSVGRAATPASPHENVPHSSNVHPVRNETADRSGSARPFSALLQSQSPLAAFSLPPMRNSFPRAPWYRRRCSRLILPMPQSRARSASRPGRKFFESSPGHSRALNQKRIGTTQSPRPDHLSVRSMRQVVALCRYSVARPHATHRPRRFAGQATLLSAAFGSAVPAKPPLPCPLSNHDSSRL